MAGSALRVKLTRRMRLIRDQRPLIYRHRGAVHAGIHRFNYRHGSPWYRHAACRRGGIAASDKRATHYAFPIFLVMPVFSCVPA